MTMVTLALALLVLLFLGGPARAAGDRPPAEVRPRVEHHVRQASALADHFDSVMHAGCPRFGSPQKWNAYVDSEVDRVILLMAHVEQAWEEAKTTGDDDVRRAGKAPRGRLAEARGLMEKLSACAEANGSSLPVASIWQRIQSEVPRRQAEIALPSRP